MLEQKRNLKTVFYTSVIQKIFVESLPRAGSQPNFWATRMNDTD